MTETPVSFDLGSLIPKASTTAGSCISGVPFKSLFQQLRSIEKYSGVFG